MAIYTHEQTDGNLISRNSIIDKIGDIISEYGEFYINKVRDELPFKDTYGNLTHLITYLCEDYCYIEVFSEQWGDEKVDAYTILYKSLTDSELEEILEICQEYKKQQDEQ